MSEPYSYRLPVDPLDLVPKIYASVANKPYTETLHISAAAAKLLKSTMQQPTGIPKSEAVLNDPGK